MIVVCIVLPKLVIEVDPKNNRAIIQLEDNTTVQVNTELVSTVEVGNYVILQANYITDVYTKEEVAETLETWEEVKQFEKTTLDKN